jgi:protein-arginine kinase activator protein McsA
MDLKELKQKQKELNKEEVICKKCGDKTVWGVFRKMGCLNCYYREQEIRSQIKNDNY